MKPPVQNQKGLADLSKCMPQNWLNHPKGAYFFVYEASVAKLNLFQPSIKLPSIAGREALPFEGPAPPPAVRKRKTYVTLECAIMCGKTIGCKGCDRIAEGVP